MLSCFKYFHFKWDVPTPCSNVLPCQKGFSSETEPVTTGLFCPCASIVNVWLENRQNHQMVPINGKLGGSDGIMAAPVLSLESYAEQWSPEPRSK